MSHCYLLSLSLVLCHCVYLRYIMSRMPIVHIHLYPRGWKNKPRPTITQSQRCWMLKDVPANDSFGNYSISNEGRIDLYAWRFLWTSFHFGCWVVIPFDNKKELFPDPLFIIFTISNTPELRLLIQFLTDCWPSKCTDMLCNWKTFSTKCLFLNGAH